MDREQKEPEKLQPGGDPPREIPNAGNRAPLPTVEPVVVPRKHNTHFFMMADMDITRVNRDVGRLTEEVINHLTGIDGARVSVRIQVEAEMPSGTPNDTVRTINQNCSILNVRDFGFDDD